MTYALRAGITGASKEFEFIFPSSEGQVSSLSVQCLISPFRYHLDHPALLSCADSSRLETEPTPDRTPITPRNRT